MSVAARTVAAMPVRTSAGTWRAICTLLAPEGSAGRARLEAVTNIAAILITAEYTRQAPVVMIPPDGPRVRIRTAHGSDAIDAHADETQLVAQPCAGNGWTVSLPCGADDNEEIRAALVAHPGIEVRDVTDGVTAAAPIEKATGGRWSIDYNEMERP